MMTDRGLRASIRKLLATSGDPRGSSSLSSLARAESNATANREAPWPVRVSPPLMAQSCVHRRTSTTSRTQLVTIDVRRSSLMIRLPKGRRAK